MLIHYSSLQQQQHLLTITQKNNLSLGHRKIDRSLGWSRPLPLPPPTYYQWYTYYLLVLFRANSLKKIRVLSNHTIMSQTKCYLLRFARRGLLQPLYQCVTCASLTCASSSVDKNNKNQWADWYDTRTWRVIHCKKCILHSVIVKVISLKCKQSDTTCHPHSGCWLQKWKYKLILISQVQMNNYSSYH